MPPIRLTAKVIFLSLFLIKPVSANGSIEIKNAWSPEAPPITKVMAGYMEISNLSNSNIKIQSAKSPLFKKVEIHLSDTHNGMMRMVKQDNLLIKAKSRIVLKSGALHMMLIGRKKVIRHKALIPVTLLLNNGEEINFNLLVRETAPEKHHH